MPEKEYTHIRGIALGLANRMPEENMCLRGMGECCSGENGKALDVKITKGDIAIMASAIINGSIPEEYVRKAKDNLQDPSKTSCPWYDNKKRECTIYDQRPIVCAAYGIGGFQPLNSLGASQEENLQEESFVPMVDFPGWHTRCDSCIAKGIVDDELIPIKDIKDVTDVLNYASQNGTSTIRKFVGELE